MRNSNVNFRRILANVVLPLVSAGIAVATDFYVSPSGSAGGNGSIGQPWNLQTALNQPSSVHPGDTLWLRGGTYGGSFTSRLAGGSGAPIVVRQYPGERAILDGNGGGATTLSVNGSWTWFWGFEIMNSNTQRFSSASGSFAGPRNFGVDIYGPNTRFINMIVHDTDQGIGFWVGAESSELYGNIIYYNGWMAPDRGHGHGIYVQNQNNTKRMVDNIIFDQFSHGIHAYTQGSFENNLYLEGNVSFNNGLLEGSLERNILIGPTSNPAQNPSLISNYTYFTPSAGLGENNLGYFGGCVNGTVSNNYFAGGTALHIQSACNPSVNSNTFYDTVGATSFYPNNTYYSNGNKPSGVKVFVRPNQYETGRANITIFNWDHVSTVNVDLSSVLGAGTNFEIRDAENFFGAPVTTGFYGGGMVAVPMSGLTVAQTVGSVAAAPTHTAPEFGVFVVLPRGTTTPPTGDTTPPSISLTAPGQGQTVSGSIAVSAAASDNVGVAGVQFKLDGANLGPEILAPPYTMIWASAAVSNGNHNLTAVARDAANNQTTAAAVPVNVSNVAPIPGSSSASFIKLDSTTKGSWKGVYGSDGSVIVNDTPRYPSYAQVTPNSQSLVYTWSGSTTDVRALQKSAASDRIASTWYSSSGFGIDVNLADGKSHVVSAYLLDYDSGGVRAETIDVVDAASGALLDSHNLSGFSSGQYLVWNITGHVVIRASRTAGSNAVLSGIFFGVPVASAAAFVKSDTTTQGAWKGLYGTDGSILAGDLSNPPSYAQVTLANQSNYTWTASTTDARALQNSSGTGRIAAAWYSANPFTIDINLTDGLSHTTALYFVDWDSSGVRAESVDVLDANTGAVLDSRSVSGFVSGDYLVWNLSGHVTIRVTKTAGYNAVVSGIFFK